MCLELQKPQEDAGKNGILQVKCSMSGDGFFFSAFHVYTCLHIMTACTRVFMYMEVNVEIIVHLSFVGFLS